MAEVGAARCCALRDVRVSGLRGSGETFEAWGGGEERAGVGMLRVGHEVVGVAGFDDSAGLHDGDVVG